MSARVECVQVHRAAPPRLAVLVRVKNEMAQLPEFWRRLQRQTAFSQLEVVFLDSGSQDGTLEFLRALPVSLYRIPPADFQFGSSCNLIASLSTAPNLAYFSGHVLLEQEDALAKVLDVLARDEYAALYLRQVPNTLTGSSAYERAHLARRFPPASEPLVELLAPQAFSNAASALTRPSWERSRFPEVAASEDFLWARTHLDLGGRLYYLPAVTAMHSHNEEAEAVFRRVLLNVRARRLRPSPLRAAVYFAGVFASLLRHGASWPEAFRYACSHAQAHRQPAEPSSAGQPRRG
ncbi:MAG: glycosyltransferase [Acidobacteriota bacterium]|nr:glycosyltransferase [Acidobacteriota bacterium]